MMTNHEKKPQEQPYKKRQPRIKMYPLVKERLAAEEILLTKIYLNERINTLGGEKSGSGVFGVVFILPEFFVTSR
jgi:hypothetical protein